MKKMACIILIALLSFASNNTTYADGPLEEKHHNVLIESNLSYLLLSALSTNESNVLLVLPLYSQIACTPLVGMDVSLVFIFNENEKTTEDNAMLLMEAGVSIHPNRSLHGWTIGVLPGLIYSFDSRTAGFSVLVNGGYQWVLGNGLVLGALVGGRYVRIDGYMVIPDIALNIGWKIK